MQGRRCCVSLDEAALPAFPGPSSIMPALGGHDGEGSTLGASGGIHMKPRNQLVDLEHRLAMGMSACSGIISKPTGSRSALPWI